MSKEKITKLPNCDKCGCELMIDEWEGCVLRCMHCDIEYRQATDEEVVFWEEWMDNHWKKEAYQKRFIIANKEKRKRFSYNRRVSNVYGNIIEKPIRANRPTNFYRELKGSVAIKKGV